MRRNTAPFTLQKMKETFILTHLPQAMPFNSQTRHTGAVEIKKLTFSLNDVSEVVRDLAQMVREFQKKYNLALENMVIAMPHPFRSALSWYLTGRTQDPPDFFRSIKIVPAYDNKIVLFTPDWQMVDIDPVFLELNNPELYA